MTADHAIALKEGTVLKEYIVESVLGEGGFGITYLARQDVLNKRFAVKEYLPRDIATRVQDGSVRPISKASAEDFDYGLDRFIKEARLLARFRHPNIVQVQHFFKANGTAYLVMDYEEGQSFSTVLRRHGVLEESELREIITPLLHGLSEVHKAGVLHRDIKPGNIFIRKDGKPLLLDFGAARHALGAHSRSLTSIVTPGFAPYEQYYAAGEQGPPSDIYGLGATLYLAVTGERPAEAPARIRNDTMIPASTAGKKRFSAGFLAAIDAALAVDPEDRPQDVDEWLGMFEGGDPGGTIVLKAPPKTAKPKKPKTDKKEAAPPGPGAPPVPPGPAKEPWKLPRGTAMWLMIGAAVIAGVAAIAAVAYMWDRDSAQRAAIQALLKDAAAHVSAGRFTRPPGNNAFASYRRIIALDPGNAEAKEGLKRVVAGLVARATGMIRGRRFAQAEVELKEARRIGPNDPAVAAAEGRLAEARKRALSAENQARVLDLVRQADAAIGRQAFDRAEARLRDAARIIPNHPDIRAARGRLEQARQRFLAEENAKEVRRLVRAADAAIRRQAFDEADARLKEAHRIVPGHPEIVKARTRLSKARQQAAAREQEARVHALIRAADAAIAKRDFDGAQARLREAERIVPGHSEIARARTRLVQARQQAAAQEKEAKVRALVRAANAAIARRQYGQAEARLREADRIVPNHPAVLRARASLARAQGAAKSEERVRKLVRDAEAAIARKDLPLAKSLLDSASRISRRHPDVLRARRLLARAAAEERERVIEGRVASLVAAADQSILGKRWNQARRLLNRAARLRPRHALVQAARARLAAAIRNAESTDVGLRVRRLVQRADRAIERRDFTRAQTLLATAGNIKPGDPSVRAARARLAAARRGGTVSGVSCAGMPSVLSAMLTSQRDCFLMRRTRALTLQERRPGITNRWRNTRSGVVGTVTVLQTYTNANGNFCRRYRQTVTARGRTRQANGVACLVNNRWRISG